MLDGSSTLLQAQASLATETARAQANPMAHAGSGADRARATRAAQDFESFVLGQMLQPMFQGLSTDPPFGGGHAEEVWRSFLVNEYGKMMAASGRTGIADAVMRSMLSQQEV